MYTISIDTIVEAIRLTNFSNGGDDITIDRAFPCEPYDTCFAIRCRSAHTPARFLGAVGSINGEDAVALTQAQQVPTDDEDDRVVVYFPGIILTGPLCEFDEPDGD